MILLWSGWVGRSAAGGKGGASCAEGDHEGDQGERDHHGQQGDSGVTADQHGAEDAAIEPHVAELTAKHLPRATGPVWIDGAAHAANMTHPEPVNAAVVAFLAELSR